MLNLIPLLLALLAPTSSQTSPPVKWHIKGVLSEACTCAVPCSCNFGEGPSPHHYCYTMVAYTIKEGEYNGISLAGLHFGGAMAQAGKVLYLDERAKPEQKAALEKVARIAIRSGLGPDDLGIEGRKTWKAIVYTHFTHEVGDRGNTVDFGGPGGFKSDYIFGRDRTKPVVVENNTIWAIERAIKGKTSTVRYKDGYGNSFDDKNTNSNTGDFDYNETSKL